MTYSVLYSFMPKFIPLQCQAAPIEQQFKTDGKRVPSMKQFIPVSSVYFKTALKYNYWKPDHVEKAHFKLFEEFHKKSTCAEGSRNRRFVAHLMFEEYKEATTPPYNKYFYS